MQEESEEKNGECNDERWKENGLYNSKK